MNTVVQLSVLMENKNGSLSQVLKILNDNQIMIRGLAITETTTFGILKIIVDRYNEAQSLLREAGFVVTQTEVYAIGIEGYQKDFLDFLLCLESKNIGVEYMYMAVGMKHKEGFVILRTEDGVDISDLLIEKDIPTISSNEIQK